MSARSEVAALVNKILAAIPAGSLVRFKHIPAPPRVQRRVAGAERSELLIGKARQIREADGTPFWHALFLAGESRADGVPLDILRSALYHQTPDETSTFELANSADAVELIVSRAMAVRGRDAFAMDSRVDLPGGDRVFIPMLDFAVKSDRVGADATARAAVEALGEPGSLFASGRSYHFYGSRLVDEEDQLEYWSKALLLTPIVDERWIAHQIRSGFAALRVSPSERGRVPTLIADYRRL